MKRFQCSSAQLQTKNHTRLNCAKALITVAKSIVTKKNWPFVFLLETTNLINHIRNDNIKQVKVALAIHAVWMQTVTRRWVVLFAPVQSGTRAIRWAIADEVSASTIPNAPVICRAEMAIVWIHVPEPAASMLIVLFETMCQFALVHRDTEATHSPIALAPIQVCMTNG